MAESQQVRHDHNDHIIRTKEQWEDRALANYAIPRGVLCIELTSKTETRLKIGEGDKFYRQLPYVGGSGGDLSNYYTKQEIDNIIANLNFMSVASTRVYDSKDQLPTVGNSLGDLRFVKGENVGDDPYEYLWNGTKWLQLGGIANIDLSKYVTREEIMPRVQRLENASHTHTNKSILDAITASYTREEKIKLANLKNYDDTQIKQDVSTLKQQAHTHPNKEILDQTTAAYTREEKTKLGELENYDDFVGTDGRHPGTHGLVPAPTTMDQHKFLSGDGTWKSVSAGGIEPATTETLGGVIVGQGLSITNEGVLSTTGGGGSSEYVAGDGISIDQGETTSDITSLPWEQGSINPTNGEDDDTVLTVIRSPQFETGLTQMVNVSAQATDYSDMMWKAVYYDSNHAFISMDDSWKTLEGDSTRPSNASYIVILLRKDPESQIDENVLMSCEISWPIEIGKYVITNTGVTHLEMVGSSLVSVENGETSTVMSFSEDLSVTSGVVGIPDYNRLILNVET